VGAIRRVVCASPAYLAMHGVPRHPRDLSAHQCVTFEGVEGRTWIFRSGKDLSRDAAKNALVQPVASRLAVNTAEAAIDAALMNVGVTRVLSYQVAQAVREGRLDLLLEAYEPAPWPVSLVHGGQTPLPLKLRAFLDFATPRLRARIEAARIGVAPN
jgi:DNA-binding transcriptional LysR family regulator